MNGRAISDRKLIVIEDDASTKMILKGTLRKYGFLDIEECSDGAEALKKIQENDYDMILCDWQIPSLNGLALLKKLKGMDSTAHIPFIMITGESEKESIISAMKAGVDGYIVKPFAPISIKQKLDQVFGEDI
ncbi:MAG: response regulator [Gammaproteobacteria bacterium]|nr:MAG: response regulator [Gammaproteobacteria bacterium]